VLYKKEEKQWNKVQNTKTKLRVTEIQSKQINLKAEDSGKEGHKAS
jgi:hypothetical protein